MNLCNATSASYLYNIIQLHLVSQIKHYVSSTVVLFVCDVALPESIFVCLSVCCDVRVVLIFFGVCVTIFSLCVFVTSVSLFLSGFLFCQFVFLFCLPVWVAVLLSVCLCCSCCENCKSFEGLLSNKHWQSCSQQDTLTVC